MPINDTYIIPDTVIKFLGDGQRSFLALRLVHGLLYALDNVVKGKMERVPVKFSKEHRVRTSTLAAAVGPVDAKDNRWIHKACAELEGQGILLVAKIEGRALRFKLSRQFSDSFPKQTKAFAIMQTEQIRQCRTLQDLLFLTLARLHGGKDHPRFLLPRLHVHLEIQAKPRTVMPAKPLVQDPWRASWSSSSRSWVNAAIRTSEILGHGYLIAPRQDLVDDFVSEVAVKIQHDKTAWERGTLYKFPPGTRGVIELPAGGKKSVLRADCLRNKWHQTVIM